VWKWTTVLSQPLLKMQDNNFRFLSPVRCFNRNCCCFRLRNIEAQKGKSMGKKWMIIKAYLLAWPKSKYWWNGNRLASTGHLNWHLTPSPPLRIFPIYKSFFAPIYRRFLWLLAHDKVKSGVKLNSRHNFIFTFQRVQRGV